MEPGLFLKLLTGIRDVRCSFVPAGGIHKIHIFHEHSLLSSYIVIIIGTF